MLKIKEYARPESLAQAYEWNQKKSSCVIGGMLWLKMSHKNVGMAIDLSGLGLDRIREDGENFRVGAMVTLRELELHQGLDRYTEGALGAALRDIVGVQFRNLATAGGSVFGRFGFSDVLTVLLAMDTYVKLYRAGEIPLGDFLTRKRDRDILEEIRIRKQPGFHMVLSGPPEQQDGFSGAERGCVPGGDRGKTGLRSQAPGSHGSAHGGEPAAEDPGGNPDGKRRRPPA